MSTGVTIDVLEQSGEAGGSGRGSKSAVGGSKSAAGAAAGGDSAIVITFDGMDSQPIAETVVQDWAAPLHIMDDSDAAIILQPPPPDPDRYLREELAALVEGMVRAYARRRWRPLLEQFEVLEVEREGEWKLGEHRPDPDYNFDRSESFDLHFLSRHDALLLERSTGYLYLQSYKTTGSWDRRKEMDAQIDMQGLSEGVDVERRFAEAWERNKQLGWSADSRQQELVSERVAEWLSTLPEPPTILGVRYEYLLKGSRKKDKNDPELPNRYVQDTPLIRAYKQDGVTVDDRRWATSYDWYDASGKSRRLDYRSWQKAAVWKIMPIADWIDMLDKGEVQPDALDQDGNPLDVLAEQFVTPLTVYRNQDDFYDMVEGLEAQEVQIAKDVAEVRHAREQGGAAAERSALNRLFGKNRRGCVYPGKCEMWEICHGAPEIRRDPEASGLYVQRTANHPKEFSSLTQITLDNAAEES
jgi:hypothetical protein